MKGVASGDFKVAKYDGLSEVVEEKWPVGGVEGQPFVTRG